MRAAAPSAGRAHPCCPVCWNICTWRNPALVFTANTHQWQKPFSHQHQHVKLEHPVLPTQALVQPLFKTGAKPYLLPPRLLHPPPLPHLHQSWRSHQAGCTHGSLAVDEKHRIACELTHLPAAFQFLCSLRRLTLFGSFRIRYLPSSSLRQMSMTQRRIPQAFSMLRLIWLANSLGLNCWVPRMTWRAESFTWYRET